MHSWWRSSGGFGEWGFANLDEDNTLAVSRRGIYLPDKPSKFKFCDPQVFGDIRFASKKGEWEEADVPKGESVGEMEEVWHAVMALDAKLNELVDTLKINQVGMMDHLWSSITCLGSTLDSLHTRVHGVEQEVGNTAAVLDEYNLVNLSEGVIWALG
jgi:hypothetical protein